MGSRLGAGSPGQGGRQYIGPMRFPWRPTFKALPGICQVCHAWPADPVCAECREQLAVPRHRCERCAVPLNSDQAQCGACLLDPDALSRCVAAVDYGYPWDRLIARFKFENEPAWAHSLARLMAEAPGAVDLWRDCDGVVPIPLAAARLAERGYNQSWELAKALRRLAGDAPAPWPQALVRVGLSPDQHRLSRVQRLNNLSGAFAAHPAMVPRLAGAHVLLIDDVSTAGATLRAAAGALRQAGARQVSALVLARTPMDVIPAT